MLYKDNKRLIKLGNGQAIFQFHPLPQSGHRFQRLLASQFLCFPFGDQDKVVGEELAARLVAVFLDHLVSDGLHIHQQRVFHPKDRVGRLVGIVANIEGPVWMSIIIDYDQTSAVKLT